MMSSLCVFVICCVFVFFFKQKTAYEMRISDWSSDVCSSDLSLDRYDFPLDIVNDLSAADAAATLVAFTARSVALGAQQLPERPALWIICGGGRHNPVIMEALREVLGDCESADDFGLRGDFIEAEALGFIAARSVRGDRKSVV